MSILIVIILINIIALLLIARYYRKRYNKKSCDDSIIEIECTVNPLRGISRFDDVIFGLDLEATRFQSPSALTWYSSVEFTPKIPQNLKTELTSTHIDGVLNDNYKFSLEQYKCMVDESSNKFLKQHLDNSIENEQYELSQYIWDLAKKRGVEL